MESQTCPQFKCLLAPNRLEIFAMEPGALVVGALLGDVVSKLSSAIIKAINKTRFFKSHLTEMKNNVEGLRPYAEELDELNKKLGRPKEETYELINLLKQAAEFVRKCEDIKGKFWMSYHYAPKLDTMNKKLRNFVELHLPIQTARDIKAISKGMKDLKNGVGKGSSNGWRSSVPLPKGHVVGFDDQVSRLKAMVLKDSPNGDCSIVVVSAAGGSGKTTLVTLLCHDPDIRRRFEGNIYYVTVSESYDVKVVITKLLGLPPNITSNEEAIQQWGSFLGDNDQSEILLVLDDVWSESVIMDFKFKARGYKILVTSRMTFDFKFKAYKMLALNNEDATRLFRESALSEDGHANISADIVDKLVRCCKNHPLALSVVGGSLKGKHVVYWERMLDHLDEKKISLLDLHESVKICLEKSLYFFEKELEMKQCYLDLGLFPEDQKIAATALLDMWAHLYNHDDGGWSTFDILTKLSSRNFATLLPIRKHLSVIANYCEEKYVVQHDMMRALAIQLSRRQPIEHRERLIINTDGQDLQLPQVVNASILSVSTGHERLYSTWNEINFPRVEFFVLNFMSNMHPLPQCMQNMERLKVLVITNYGYFFSEILNFPAPQYLSGLTRIRLDHVSISSISSTILMLENLQKLSLIMCKIGKSFNQGIPNKLTSLLEIDIESCDDLATFPAMLCNLVGLKKLSITNCHELTSISEEFGNLSSLEVLRLASCSKLPTLPESTRNLKKLRMINLSHCLNLRNLPLHIGSLQSIDVRGCTELHELPKLVKDFDTVKVVCDEEVSHRWRDLENVKVEVVVEDALDTFYKIMPKGHNK